MMLTFTAALTYLVAGISTGTAPAPTDSLRDGRIETFRVSGAPFTDSVTVQVYLPAGYMPSARYPTLYAFHPVHDYFGDLGLATALDSATAAGLPPMLAVGLPAIVHHDKLLLDAPELETWQRLVMERIIPAVEARYAADTNPDGRHLLAFSAGANVLLDLAVRHPARFGRVAAQSPGWMVWDPERQMLAAVHIDIALRQVDAAPGARWPAFWFMWGDAASGWEADSRAHGARYVAALRARGAAVAEPVVVPGNHNLRLVTASLPLALRFLGARDE